MSVRVLRPPTAFFVLAASIATLAQGQDRKVYTAADYDRAVAMLPQSLGSLVIGGSVRANWLPNDRFWYRSTTANGFEYVLIDPAKKTRSLLFETSKLVAALSAAAGKTYEASRLPFDQINLATDGNSVSFVAEGKQWTCDVKGTRCTVTGDAPKAQRIDRNAIVSPDGKRAAFIRNWNLWVRDVATAQEKQLTTDGVENFGYATDNAGWIHSDRAKLLWSPDSRKIATQQQDERNVGEMYLVETKPGHPTLHRWKYPLPGDSVVAMIHRVVIDVDGARVVRLQMAPDFHRATLGDDISMDDYAWSPDGKRLVLISSSRDHKKATVRLADTETGAVRTIFEETSPTHLEAIAGFRVFWGTNELIWSSQRDNWGQLYLYDMNTGSVRRQITTGEGPVTDIERVEERARTLWVRAYGREAGQDPYFRHYYRVGVDGGWVSLTPDDGDHDIQISPSGKYLVDTYSKPNVPPVVTLRDRDGKLVMPLEKADISRLLATGWKPPVPVTMKGRDGKTDIYGLMYLPTKLDSTKKYPIVNNAYPGPQSGSVGGRTFAAGSGQQALAELGFVVVSIDGMGTPNRSKSFHDTYYGAMGRDNTLPDQVGGMKRLAERYGFIDIDRAGMYGHSGGGFITADALFRYPDFFKVGVSQSGNHDQRCYEDDWGERYQGLLTKTSDSADNYGPEASQTVAKNLKGHLLLAHGGMDDNVPPYCTLLVVDALIKANKDFDLIIYPNHRHGYGSDGNYMTRRRWDYFVRYLLGAEPPKGYEIKAR